MICKLLNFWALPHDSTCLPEAESGKLDIKGRESDKLNSIDQLAHWFTYQTDGYDLIIDLCVDLASLMSFKQIEII